MTSQLADEIFNEINKIVEISLSKILKDISTRYDIDLGELETQYIDTSNKKKKTNGYNKYNKKRRKEMLEKNSKMNFGEMSKIIGEEWRNLSEKERQKYK